MDAKNPRQRLGRHGEELACRWLTNAGLHILDKNWRCSFGELDIVAREGDVLVFVEVKTRRSTAFGHPAESVTAAKVARLRKLAGAWVAEHRQPAAGMRLDVVAILAEAGRPPRLQHIKGVGA